jgi:hypothetical protein
MSKNKTVAADSAKHTPGPWKLSESLDEKNALTHSVVDSSGFPISYALPNTHALPELMANARLLAAAPDLLEAAIAALSIISIERPDGSICADLIAAIRKAKGVK